MPIKNIFGGGGNGAQIDHGGLAGLEDDDHTDYLTSERADTWLGTKTTDNLSQGSANLYCDAASVAKIILGSACQGRLTLENGVAIPTSDQTAKTTIYFTPFNGNLISLYTGTVWSLLTFTEKSVAVPATTVTPFDVFAYIDSGAVAIQTVDWANDTTRATDLALQDGVLVKSGAATHRYLGTGRTTGVSGQCEDSVTSRFLWNYYNRVPRRLYISPTSSSNYSTSIWRYYLDDAANGVAFVAGKADIAVPICSANLVSKGYIGTALSLSAIETSFTVIHNQGDAFIRLTTTSTIPFAAGYNHLGLFEWGATNFEATSVVLDFALAM